MTTSPITDPVEAPHWTIRPELPVDLDQIHELHRTAFRGPDEAELVDAVRSSAAFIPELSLVATTDEGSILGHVLISRIELARDGTDDEPARIPVLALAPIAVLPQHEGRGIGTALMEAALAVADEREEPMIVVLGSPAFYRRFGFVPAAEHNLTGPYDDARDAFQVRARRGGEIARGRLIYPPTFGSA
ncbi:MAG TPA: N-acetyltransferase [Candidatus Limnocylindrales bacterium]|nr:N-acetyltransferase [Candidatus Limnocylindrales bacterium]